LAGKEGEGYKVTNRFYECEVDAGRLVRFHGRQQGSVGTIDGS